MFLLVTVWQIIDQGLGFVYCKTAGNLAPTAFAQNQDLYDTWCWELLVTAANPRAADGKRIPVLKWL